MHAEIGAKFLEVRVEAGLPNSPEPNRAIFINRWIGSKT